MGSSQGLVQESRPDFSCDNRRSNFSSRQEEIINSISINYVVDTVSTTSPVSGHKLNLGEIMKKLLAILTIALSFAATAQENVTIYYAFSPADSMANYSRALAKEANRIQTKYNFISDTKPGAGNAIAANFVKANPNTILHTSSAFFVRPEF